MEFLERIKWIKEMTAMFVNNAKSYSKYAVIFSILSIAIKNKRGYNGQSDISKSDLF